MFYVTVWSCFCYNSQFIPHNINPVIGLFSPHNSMLCCRHFGGTWCIWFRVTVNRKVKFSSYISGQSLRLMGEGCGPRALCRLKGTVNMKLWYNGLWLSVHGCTLNGLVTVFCWLTIGIDWPVASPLSPKSLQDYLLIYPQYCLSKFYICSSVHHNSRLKKSNKMQLYADIYLLLNYSTCFGRPLCPSSGVHKTVVAASGTDHTVSGASFFKCDQIRRWLRVFIWSCLKKLPSQIVWFVPEAATTVLCPPDDGRNGRPKHVE